MGIFGFLFKKEGESEKQISKIHETLKDSFSNVKKDITNLHSTIHIHKEHTSNRFQELEEKIKKIELLFNTQQVLQKHRQKPIIKKEETEEPQEEIDNAILNILAGLPKSELKLFKTLYELQLSLNAKQISYKSLASYLYPGKDYNSIRSTITQFVLRLNTEGLVEKQRIGKETYVKISQNGHKILKDTKNKRMLKEIEATST